MGASVRPDINATIDSLIDAGLSDAEIKARLTGGTTPSGPGVLSRAGSMALNVVKHPLETGRAIATDATNALKLIGAAGSASEAPTAALPPESPARQLRLTPEQYQSGIRGTVGFALAPIGGATSSLLARIGAPALAANMGGAAALGAATSAATNPSDPFASAIAGGTLGGLAAPVASLGLKSLSRLGGGTLDVFGARPTGRTAAEMAADRATVNAPVGPQAGASEAPMIDRAMMGGPQQPVGGRPPSPRVVQPTALQRARAAVGQTVTEATPIESAKTVALRQLAERLNNDAVTRPDALAFANQAGSKPVAVLDLGGGNVGGLARLAKDVPGLARRQIPEFLTERMAGTRDNPGATLQRITSDAENRLGLAPENYYQTAKQMADQQKALSKPAYDKVRNIEVDDPELLDLFDIPEFRKLHGMIANAERIRPDGAKIRPLSTTTEGEGGVTTKVQNPQTLGTLDKMRQAAYNIASGKIEGAPIDRFTAQAMYERLGAITQRMDQLYPDYAEARAGFSGRERMMDAHAAGKEDFLKLDPREIQAKLAEMSPGEADMYRKGGYDALRVRLSKMGDARNIGQWLDDNPDIRERVAALAKNPSDAAAFRSDIGVEAAMGQRRNMILGGPNTAERLIDYQQTQPKVSHIESAVRSGPVKATAGFLANNMLTRAAAQRTADVMGEAGKLLTRTGRQGINQTFDEMQALANADLERRLFREAFAQQMSTRPGARTRERR